MATPESNISLTSLDRYTEGDSTFKKELIGHLLGNLEELNIKLEQAVHANSADSVRFAIHKIKTTIEILSLNHLRGLLEQMVELLEKPNLENESKALLSEIKLSTEEISSALSKAQAELG